LFVGWLIPRKGCEYLLNAIKEIITKEKNILLLIIGEGILENKLKNLTKELQIQDKVQFLGKKAPPEIPFYMNASDIFVLPSLSEGKPNVVGEAMASGLPVIATDINGTSDFITNNKNGFLIPKENSKILAERLLQLLKNPKLRIKLGKEARNSVKDLTWENCAKEYLKVYSKFF